VSRDPRDAIWLPERQDMTPELRQMVDDAAGGLRDHADEVEHDPALRPTAGLPAPDDQED
jgi:hypothetical protein